VEDGFDNENNDLTALNIMDTLNPLFLKNKEHLSAEELAID